MSGFSCSYSDCCVAFGTTMCVRKVNKSTPHNTANTNRRLKVELDLYVGQVMQLADIDLSQIYWY